MTWLGAGAGAPASCQSLAAGHNFITKRSSKRERWTLSQFHKRNGVRTRLPADKQGRQLSFGPPCKDATPRVMSLVHQLL